MFTPADRAASIMRSKMSPHRAAGQEQGAIRYRLWQPPALPRIRGVQGRTKVANACLFELRLIREIVAGQPGNFHAWHLLKRPHCVEPPAFAQLPCPPNIEQGTAPAQDKVNGATRRQTVRLTQRHFRQGQGRKGERFPQPLAPWEVWQRSINSRW
jgi:hypothetical protein